MCLFILLIIFIGFCGLTFPFSLTFLLSSCPNQTNSFPFSLTFLPKQTNIKRLLKRLSGQARLLKRPNRVKIKVFDRLAFLKAFFIFVCFGQERNKKVNGKETLIRIGKSVKIMSNIKRYMTHKVCWFKKKLIVPKKII